MNPFHLQSPSLHVSTISRCDRWQAYQRLQELGIPCHCSLTGHLEVEISSPVAIFQVKSVMQQLTSPRAELINWLEDCWRAKMLES